MPLHEVTFRLQLVTPTYLGGADPRVDDPELRVPSIRGALRYWLRAAIGATVGDNITALHQAESAVFGSTEGQSPVQIWISNPSAKSEKTPDFWKGGKGYLFWYMKAHKNKETREYEPARQYILPTTTTEAVLHIAAKDTRVLRAAIAALWLLTHLGGIGARSRRGAGSLSATLEPKGQPIDLQNLPFETPQNVGELKKQLKEGIDIAKEICSELVLNAVDKQELARLYPVTSLPKYDMFAPGYHQIWVLQPSPTNDAPDAPDQEQTWPSVDGVLDALGRAIQNFRSFPGSGRRPARPKEQRALLGAPVGNNIRDRHASPLAFRISSVGVPNTTEERYVGMAVLFKSRFPAADSEKKHNGRTGNVPHNDRVDYSCIEKWMKNGYWDWEGEQYFHAEEVKL